MRRLVSETDDAFERTLLESVRLDELPQPGAQKAALALEFALRNLPVAPNPGLPHPAGASANAGTLGIWKWLSIGVVVGGVAGAGAMASYDRAVVFATARAPGAASAVTTTASAPVAPAEAPPQAASVSSSPALVPSAAAPAKAPVASTERSAETPSRAPAADSPSTLAAEAAAIDRARRALSAGSASSAIDLLDRYDRESPTHALAPDAQALRIQAEKARGNDAVATKLAEKFLASHPNDPHADRVRRVLSGARQP